MRGFQVLQKKIQKRFKSTYSILFKLTHYIKGWYILVLVALVNLMLLVLCLYLLNLARTLVLSNIAVSDIQAKPYPYLSQKQDMELTAESVLVFEKDSRVVVFGKNENLRFSPASTSKIMTALIALEHYTPGTILTVDSVDGVEGSKMGLVKREEMNVEDLLYGLMLPSGNDAAYVLSQHYPGGESLFVVNMNKKARQLKLFNTHFVDSAGYSDNNYSTAFDLARLAGYAIQNPTLKEIIRTQKKVVYDKTLSRYHKLVNLNELLGTPGVSGVKTGFTEEARGVLITSYEQDGVTYIIVVLKSEDRFGDTRRLISQVVGKVQHMAY